MEKVKKQEMESLFVGYNQAVALKELGFDIPVNASWIINKMYPQGIIGFGSWQNSNSSDNHLSAPLKQQVFRWFRKEYNKLSAIDHSSINGWYFVIREMGGITDPMLTSVSVGKFETYEEAESACIDKLITIIKNK